MPSLLNDAFMRLSKRAEMNDPAKLVATFVDVGPLFKLLSTKDHQILHGRRGTGKTHALTYLAEIKRKDGHITINIDLRLIGSTGGIYSDNNLPTSLRATRLLVDLLEDIHDKLCNFFIINSEIYDLSQVGPILDRLAESITEVQLSGNIERESTLTDTEDYSRSSNAELNIANDGLMANIGGSKELKEHYVSSKRVKEAGVIKQHVQFGTVGRDLSDISNIISGKRIWLLLDEWSSIPVDLQPYLADLLRRAILPIRNFTVKIAAIEQRSKFSIHTENRDYIGMEIGADIAADLNLDDFIVFDNSAERSKKFFQELLFRHFKETEDLDVSSGPNNSVNLIKQAFTQSNAFDEFVRATEGVPRDAMYIMASAAQKALTDSISVNHIRAAASDWYQRDKETAVRSIPEAYSLLRWIIDNVIGKRKARAFLLHNDNIPRLIEDLFDARVVHILKKNISSRSEPGARYDVYKLDYGCYVDLISTVRAPQGLLQEEDDNGNEIYIDVPPDDYRAIRRAILHINEFYKDRDNPKQQTLFQELD